MEESPNIPPLLASLLRLLFTLLLAAFFTTNLANLSAQDLDQQEAQEEDLVVQLGFSKQATLQYRLNYQEYPDLVAAFLYFSQNNSLLYQDLQFQGKTLGVYGRPLMSLPKNQYNLPNRERSTHPQAGLAFWRNGSILRSDILVLHTASPSKQDQKNQVFFAELLQEQSKIPATLPARKGLLHISVNATSPQAQDFLAQLSKDQESYTEALEQAWRSRIEADSPEVATLLAQDDTWQRNPFGFYSRTVELGKGQLPELGEDLNITLERKAFGGVGAQALPVLVGFGRDALPMPFSYFIAQTPKDSRVEILYPPSPVRSRLSRLPAEYGSTRYQWLLDSYASDHWVYLSFTLEQ